MPTDCDKTRLGFTLPETVIALVILGMAAAGVLLPFSSGAAAQAEGNHRTLAARLANDLMCRIVATPFSQISTWNGYAEEEGKVKDVTGAVFTDPQYAGFRRDVTCTANIAVQQSASSETGFILVVVRVYDRGRLVVTMPRLIGR